MIESDADKQSAIVVVIQSGANQQSAGVAVIESDVNEQSAGNSVIESDVDGQSAGVAVIESDVNEQSAGDAVIQSDAMIQSGAVIQSDAETQADEQGATTPPSNVAHYLHSYVIVKYDDQSYVGQVVEVDVEQEEVMVKCMRKTGYNRFTWPVRDDTCWYELKDVVADISEPKLLGRHYKLDRETFDCFISPA